MRRCRSIAEAALAVGAPPIECSANYREAVIGPRGHGGDPAAQVAHGNRRAPGNGCPVTDLSVTVGSPCERAAAWLNVGVRTRSTPILKQRQVAQNDYYRYAQRIP